MPTTYAHDLFGQKVYKKMPEKVRKVIRENGDLYRIGLHGPDIFFYYMLSKNPVSKTGIRMHGERARAFFEQKMRQVRQTGSRELFAYILGFGCHYLLDSYCHPFINEAAAQGRISHTLLEIEFDRFLMEENGKNPYAYYPSDCIKAKGRYARVIHQAVPQVNTGNILISLKMMKRVTNLMVCDDGGRRRRRITWLTSLAGKKNRVWITDHMMQPQPAPGCSQPVAELNELFEEAVSQAPQALMELCALTEENKSLSERWDRTYNG